MGMMRSLDAAVSLTVVAVAVALASPASAQTVERFYAGKTVTIGVGYPPGGTYDIYARVIANYIADYIPGKPTVIVKNRPGAASLTYINELYNTAPQDGTAFGTFARSVPMDKLLGRPGANFVATELNWIGSTNSEVSLCSVWHTVGIKSVQDFMACPLVFGLWLCCCKTVRDGFRRRLSTTTKSLSPCVVYAVVV